MREFRQGRVEMTGTPKLICLLPQDVSQVLVRNVGDVTVYIGGSDVEVDGPFMGMPIYPGDAPIPVPAYEPDVMELYGVAVSDDDKDDGKDGEKDGGAAIVYIFPA